MSEKIRVLYDDGGFYLPYGGVARYFTETIKRFPDDIPEVKVDEQDLPRLA